MVSVLLTINAAGNTFVPPMFVFPDEQVNATFEKDAPAGSILAVEETGLISSKAFRRWMELFVEMAHPTKEKPVLLILDGRASHKSGEVILYAEKHHVYMLSLPPHTFHKMQPLDRAIMEPFKTAYKKACNTWMAANQAMKISLKEVPDLINTAYRTVCRMDFAQWAFKCTGLWPVNPNVFTQADFIVPEDFKEVQQPFEVFIKQEPVEIESTTPE